MGREEDEDEGGGKRRIQDTGYSDKYILEAYGLTFMLEKAWCLKRLHRLNLLLLLSPYRPRRAPA